MSYRRNTATMFCHEPTCEAFNEPQELPCAPATYWEPGYLEQDYCSSCQGPVDSSPLDVLDLLESVFDAFDDRRDLEGDRALIAALKEWKRFDAQQSRQGSERAHYAADLPF